MTTQNRPEVGSLVVTPIDDQKVREYVVLSIVVCFKEDPQLFDHEVRVDALHEPWENLVARLRRRRIKAEWGSPDKNGRWKSLDETIHGLVKGGPLQHGSPIGRGRIILALNDGAEKVFRAAAKKILAAVKKEFPTFRRGYFHA